MRHKRDFIRQIMWVNMSVIQDIINGAERHGISANDICNTANININQLSKHDSKVTLEQGHLVWKSAVELTNNNYLGLHLGVTTTTSIAGLVGHLMQTSQTLGEAFEHVSNYMSVVTNVFSYSSTINDTYFIINLNPTEYWAQNYPNSSLQATDQAIAGVINVCKLLTGKILDISKIEFTREKPNDTLEYQRILKAPLQFNRPNNSIYFTKEVANYPVLGYNEDLQHLFLKMLNAEKINNKQTAQERIKDIITQHYYNRIPSLNEVAGIMNLSTRTLQRQLQEERTSFQKIADDFKKQQAIGLLSLNKYAISEIAYLLGYAEPAIFRRAFKRWTGKTPKEVK